MVWYGDDSEVSGVRKAEIPDIMLYGGIVVNIRDVQRLRSDVEAAKAIDGCGRWPVKWNMKAIKSLYAKLGRQDVYQRLLNSSNEWRKKIFLQLSRHKVTLIVACIEHYGKRRLVQKKKKSELSQYVFSDALMRVGMHVKECGASQALVILDWPDKGDPKPYTVEYAAAFNTGEASSRKVKYFCGALSELGFHDSVMFTRSHHSTLLQVADLVVGATADFIQQCLGKREEGFGIECLRLVYHRFRGAPEQVFGRGIIISSGNTDLSNRVKRGIKDLLAPE